MDTSAFPRPFWNDGGPLLVLPQDAEAAWEGSDPPRDGCTVVAVSRAGNSNGVATDYDRACDIDPESPGTLDVGNSWGLVLGTAAAQSALCLPGNIPGEFYLVGIETADDSSPTRLRRLAATQPSAAWRPLRLQAPVGPNGLLLAHAACRPAEVRELPALDPPGTEDSLGALIGDGLRYPAPPGTYTIRACDVQSAAGEYFTFVRFEISVAAA